VNAGRWVVLCLAAAASAAAASAQGLQASAGVDSTRYLVGDWIGVHVRFVHPAGTGLQPAFGDTLGPFTVVGVGALEHLSPTESRTVVTVARYDAGAAPVPPMVFLARVPGDSTPVPIRTAPVAVEVATVPVDTAAEIRDIKPPMGIPWAAWEIASLAGFLVALALTVWNAVLAWRDRGKQAPAVPAVQPPPGKPAHVIALEQLGQLKERRLWEQGLLKPYYSEVTEIVRQYLENRYGTRALEQTTDEILESLRPFPLPPQAAGALERMLRLADLVKFARHQPAIPDHEETMKSACRFVEDTRQAAAPPAAGQRTTVHVAG